MVGMVGNTATPGGLTAVPGSGTGKNRFTLFYGYNINPLMLFLSVSGL
jgi:hypothetical protein